MTTTVVNEPNRKKWANFGWIRQKERKKERNEDERQREREREREKERS